MSEERRYNERYENQQLVLNVARPGIKGILRLNPTAECLNFSLRGLQFASKQTMKVGESLVLDLCVHEIELTEIYGEVVSCKTESNGLWCCGVKFRLGDKRMQKREITHCLLKIEDKLRNINKYPAAAN